MADYCDFCDLPLSQCQHGRPPAQNTAIIAKEQPGRWIEARFHGACSCCPGSIRPGDQIRSDGEGGWQCADCE